MTWFKLKTPFVVFISLWMLYSCSGEAFYLSNQHAVEVGFYRSKTSPSKNDIDTLLKNVWISGAGVSADSLYNNTSLSEAFLPLSFSHDPDTTIFVMRVNDKIDTLWFVHRKELDFVSTDYGYVFRFELDTLLFSGQLIDSAVIAHPVIKYNEYIENVKVYFN